MSKKVKDDYEPGDEDCSSCSGIALFSSKLINGVAEPYRCVGVRRTVKAKITPAQLDEFEDQHAVREPRNVVSIGIIFVSILST